MKRPVLTYDTETTGLPKWKEPSDSEGQPHLVQLAAKLVDPETGGEIQSMNVIIKPDGWEIPEEVSAIHGITTEYAEQHGVPEWIAVSMLLMMSKKAVRVAYNQTFDQRIIRIATKRYMNDELIEQWSSKENHHCAMMMTQKKYGKRMKLAEAYKLVCGKELINAHTAMADTQAAQEIYFALLSENEI